VSSTGISGAVLLVGWGVVENDAMEVESEHAKGGLRVVRLRRMDVPLHDVNTLVLCGLTKHPMEAPQERITEKVEIGKVDAWWDIINKAEQVRNATLVIIACVPGGEASGCAFAEKAVNGFE
jgi:hypothetical protein